MHNSTHTTRSHKHTGQPHAPSQPPSPLPTPHVQAYISAQLTLGELVVGTVFQDIKCTVDSQASLLAYRPRTYFTTDRLTTHPLTRHPLTSHPTQPPTHPPTDPYPRYQADRVGIDTVLKSSSEGQGTLAGPGGAGEDASTEPV